MKDFFVQVSTIIKELKRMSTQTQITAILTSFTVSCCCSESGRFAVEVGVVSSTFASIRCTHRQYCASSMRSFSGPMADLWSTRDDVGYTTVVTACEIICHGV